MRILIVTSHVRPSAQAVPLAAGCIRAALPAKLQQQTEIINTYPDQTTAALCHLLLAKQPAVIALSLSLWNRAAMLRLAQQLRRQCPELFLVAGGPETAGDGMALIREGALDGVIRGEGEIAFAALLEALDKGLPLPPIAGFLAADAATSHCPAAVCPDLAALPSPWLTGQLPLTENCGVLWEVARGCHFNCAFCYDAKGHQGVRPLPFERLERELRLFADAGVGQIWILDSTFNAPPERGQRLLRLLLDVAPQIHYHIEAKADFLDSETTRLLGQLSCSVQIGLQSARPEILKPLQRQLNLKKTEQVLRRLNQQGIVFGLDLIYGLPGDNHAGFCRSLDFALQQQPNQVDIFPLAILPGTDLHRRQLEFAVCGSSTPPYLVEQNRSYPPQQMDASRLLAAATDIFYNRGRAVGFFLQLCAPLKTTAADLLQQFADWLLQERRLPREQVLAVEEWTPQRILPLQIDFIRQQFARKRLGHLAALAEDLINYHFYCAEILLEEDCGDGFRLDNLKAFAGGTWQCNPAVRIAAFHHNLADLEALGALPLTLMSPQLEKDPGFGLFMRRQTEMVVETLTDAFARMLLAASRAQRGDRLLRRLDPRDAEEMIRFAVAEGLLIPVT
ncbi:MAG: radical SAM protein [Pelovirga sp.]